MRGKAVTTTVYLTYLLPRGLHPSLPRLQHQKETCLSKPVTIETREVKQVTPQDSVRISGSHRLSQAESAHRTYCWHLAGHPDVGRRHCIKDVNVKRLGRLVCVVISFLQTHSVAVCHIQIWRRSFSFPSVDRVACSSG